MMLVTVDEALLHSKITTTADLADIELKIQAASELVVDYLGDAADFLDEQGEVDPEDVPMRVKAATLMMFNYLYRQRDHDEKNEYRQGFLPRPVTAILYSKRDPTIA